MSGYIKFVAVAPDVNMMNVRHAVDCKDSLIASSEYGADVTAAVALGNVAGTQFHPEKSGDVGLAILKAFVEWEVEK